MRQVDIFSEGYNKGSYDDTVTFWARHNKNTYLWRTVHHGYGCICYNTELDAFFTAESECGFNGLHTVTDGMKDGSVDPERLYAAYMDRAPADLFKETAGRLARFLPKEKPLFLECEVSGGRRWNGRGILTGIADKKYRAQDWMAPTVTETATVMDDGCMLHKVTAKYVTVTDKRYTDMDMDAVINVIYNIEHRKLITLLTDSHEADDPFKALRGWLEENIYKEIFGHTTLRVYDDYKKAVSLDGLLKMKEGRALVDKNRESLLEWCRQHRPELSSQELDQWCLRILGKKYSLGGKVLSTTMTEIDEEIRRTSDAPNMYDVASETAARLNSEGRKDMHVVGIGKNYSDEWKCGVYVAGSDLITVKDGRVVLRYMDPTGGTETVDTLTWEEMTELLIVR